MKRTITAWLMLIVLMMPALALAGEMEAAVMENWLQQFCTALPSVPLLGDPQMTADPSRPGEYLLEYAFGTVTATAENSVLPENIVQIDVRTQQVTDCMGIRVGMLCLRALTSVRAIRSCMYSVRRNLGWVLHGHIWTGMVYMALSALPMAAMMQI